METTLYVAERFGGWQEAVLRHLATHFRQGSSGAAEYGAAVQGLLDVLRDHPDVKVRLCSCVQGLLTCCSSPTALSSATAAMAIQGLQHGVHCCS